jgi:hypothetical protein
MTTHMETEFNTRKDIENSASKTGKLILVEWITTLAVFLGCFGYLAHKIDRQSDRTDRLYEMFLDAKTDLSDYRKEADQKFYDLLKEKKS